ncbi:putative helicase with zinc finger domain [Apostichopus japonicus]|uniref:Putative helicase with zinc finger domain n=1 Tax=Stichopus japonicus TaxID=307972 RepID=A0A2G8K9D5_STIJA|nr:putative helicase with zinc finger domain [Apostichopus japonicus]
MPLSLANKDTRVVLAGDYMQGEKPSHISTRETLRPVPSQAPLQDSSLRELSLERGHRGLHLQAVLRGQAVGVWQATTASKVVPFDFLYSQREDIQEKNSTTFYNNAEVFEIAERVQELHKSWPSEWGPMEDGSIGVVTPYSDQVFRIRSELRRRHLHAVSVERVMNVQGKQFRALFISTVRTHHTCPRDVGPKSKLRPRRGDLTRAAGEEADYGFLSNDKLLNTAITRAQSLVAVVGDPVSLCAIGKCRKLWEELIKVCHINDSLHGTTYAAIKAQLSSVEMKKTFILNPMAKEFVPRFNNIMGAPVIQNLSSISSAHSHSNARMVFGFPGQGVRAPSAGNPLFSSQLRHTMPVGPLPLEYVPICQPDTVRRSIHRSEDHVRSCDSSTRPNGS